MVVNVRVLPDPMLNDRLTVTQVAIKSVLTFIVIRHPKRAVTTFIRTGLRELRSVTLGSVRVLVHNSRRTGTLIIMSFSLFNLLALDCWVGRIKYYSAFRFVRAGTVDVFGK